MSSTPQDVWDEMYRQTHQGTDLPSWELPLDDTELEDELSSDDGT